MGFISKVTGKQSWRQADIAGEIPVVEEFLLVAGMQLAAKIIGRRQATVAQWVDLHSLLEV